MRCTVNSGYSCSSCAWLFVEFLSEQRVRNVAKVRVTPLAVIEAFDVFLYCSFRVGPRRLALMVHQLVFQAAQKPSMGALS
jgi:hypothetical protein